MQGTNKATGECRLIKLNQMKNDTVLTLIPTIHFLPLLLLGTQLYKIPAQSSLAILMI